MMVVEMLDMFFYYLVIEEGVCIVFWELSYQLNLCLYWMDCCMDCGFGVQWVVMERQSDLIW